MAGSKKILIVEDDQFISEMYARALRSAGYKVDFALNGREGIQKARKAAYNLVLLDIMMPELTGMEVLQNLRGPDGRGLERTKIVILTNLAQDRQSKAALSAQADGYLIKADVVPSKLLKIINQLLGQEPDTSGRPL
jgi:two-component system, chemotaxis family, chemotaxis protein CheY